MRIAEFDVEKAWWEKRKETDQAWKVSVKDIIERNYNLDIKNPNAPTESHDDPDELLAAYAVAVQNAAEIQNHLKTSFEQSLGN
jgi:type I restriction enzyme M protein